MEIRTYEDIPHEDWLIFLKKAKDTGMPLDQVRNFIDRFYLPLPWQMEFHAAARVADTPGKAVKIGAGGSRGPGKSHAVFAQIALDDCQRFPNLKGLFLRQTGKSAQESFEDLINKVVLNKIRYKYNSSRGTLTFDNNSKIILGGFENERDVDKYVGIEYDVIGVEELNQLTRNKVEKLEGSLRTSKEGWRPRMYTSFNPGGIGHTFVKETYVTPSRKGEETTTKFIRAGYKDNPYLNTEYIDYLEGLTGDLGKAWRDGEWDIFAGQVFSEWSERLHVCNPFLPDTKRKVIIGGMDWGRAKPFSFHLAEVSRIQLEDGTKFHRVKVFLEVYGTDKTPARWWIEIKAKLLYYGVDVNTIAWVQGDPAMWTKGQDNSKSIRDQFIDANSDFGYKLQRGSNDRIGGWTNYHTWLSIAPDGLPYYMSSSQCFHLNETLPALQYDDSIHKTEDVDTENEDHAPDDQRYMLKKLKHIDASVGSVKPKQSTKRYIRGAQIIGEKQLSVDIDAFASRDVSQGDFGSITRT